MNWDFEKPLLRRLKMKIKKRMTIIVDVLVDEDFDTNYLCICEQQETGFGNPDLFLGRSENFEVLDYIKQTETELED